MSAQQSLISMSGINHTCLFYYEKKFFEAEYTEKKKTWMRQYWWLSFVYAAVYIVAIYLGQRYMKNREKFDLRKCLIAWNATLALFSFVGAVRIWPEFFSTIVYKGVEHSVCSSDYTHGVYGCWAWLFV